MHRTLPAATIQRQDRRLALLAITTMAAIMLGMLAPVAAHAAPPANNAFPVLGETRDSSCVNGFGDPRSGGRTHQGLDCFGGLGRPLLAVEDGTIRYATAEPTGCGSGNRVSLRGNSNYRYYYGHLQTISVSEGQTVRKGDVIGTMGQTGNAHPNCGGGGVHLHFEVAYGEGNAENPWTWMGSWVNWAVAGQSIEGVLDSVSVSGANVRVAGWAFQRPSTTATTSIDVRINETTHARTTGVARSDVVAAYSLPSTARPGFDTTIGLPGPGSFRVCVTARAGSNSKSLGCRTVSRNAATLSSGLRYQAVTPSRIRDVTVNAGQTLTWDISGTAGAKAVSATFTAVSPSGGGFFTAFRCGARPEVSTVNYVTGTTKAAQAIVPMDADGRICLYSSATTRVLMDVNGWMRSDTGNAFNPIAARRADTRSGNLGGRLSAGETATIPIAAWSGIPGATATNAPKAVALNLTALTPGATGFLTVWNCAATRPGTSSLNYAPADRVVSGSINSALSSSGNVCVYTAQAVDLVVDVQGWYGSTGRTYRAMEPTRLVDTRSTNPVRNAGRNGLQVAAGGTIRYDIGGAYGIPTGAAAATNTATVDHNAPGFLTTWNCASTRPNVSHLNYDTSFVNNNSSQVATNSAGELCTYSSAASHVIVDVAGMWQ